MTKFDQDGIAMSYQIATRIQVCVLQCACYTFPVIYPIPFNSHFPSMAVVKRKSLDSPKE